MSRDSSPDPLDTSKRKTSRDPRVATILSTVGFGDRLRNGTFKVVENDPSGVLLSIIIPPAGISQTFKEASFEHVNR